MGEQYPWDFHHDFSAERLIKVAGLIVAGRNAALDRFSPSIGSNAWTLGCEAFQFGRYQIAEAAGTEGFEWLSVIDPSMQFVFQVGSVPVRFYRGAADEPSVRTLRQSFSELNQLTFVFPAESTGSDLAYRIAVETDIDGAVINTAFVALRGEQPVFSWNIPLDEIAVSMTEVARERPEPVELPKPEVRVPDRDEGTARTS